MYEKKDTSRCIVASVQQRNTYFYKIFIDEAYKTGYNNDGKKGG